MKGLLLKDWKLLKNQRNLFVAVGAFAVFFCMMDQNLGFVVGYVTFVCAMTVLSTVTYDEFNNGNVFLFTLPFTRRQYVTEKYVFGLGIGTAVWLSISLATTAVGLARAQQLAMGEWVLTCLAFWVLMSLVLAISLPLQLKFGAEKGRLVLLVAYGFLIGAGVAVYYVGQMLGVQASQVTRWMESFGIDGMAAATILLVIAALALSYTISRKIVENKAF